jgi:hypothetical protein
MFSSTNDLKLVIKNEKIKNKLLNDFNKRTIKRKSTINISILLCISLIMNIILAIY